jgi:hypothetical protein
MAIISSEIKFYYSGGSGNTSAAASLGGAISTTELAAGTHNLFDVVSSAEASAGDSEYRCFYVKNTNSTLTLQSSKIWVSTDTTGAGSDVQIALDSGGVNGTAGTIANESTVPTSITGSFAAYTSEGASLSIGNIPPGEYQAIWVRRIINAGAVAVNAAGVTFTVKGDTAA